VTASTADHGSILVNDRYGSTEINMSQCGSIWVNMVNRDQCGSVWVNVGRFGSTEINVDQCGSLWIDMGQQRSIWVSTGRESVSL